MRRYFAISKKDNLLELKCDDIHHIFNVLRTNKNDKISIIYDNYKYECNADLIDKKYVKYISSTKLVDNSYNITFLLASSKANKLELVLQKTTEICCPNFIIYNSKRSVSIIESNKFNSKKDRFLKILKEACEQSKQERLNDINIIENLNQIDFNNYDLKLIAYENQENDKIITEEILKGKINILIVIGPEGGFDEDEVNYFINQGFTSISLGKSILRCETAPIYVSSVISYLKGRENL